MPLIWKLPVIACTQRPHSVPTTSMRCSHSVFIAPMTLLRLARSCCGVFTARSRRTYSVLTAIIAFNTLCKRQAAAFVMSGYTVCRQYLFIHDYTRKRKNKQICIVKLLKCQPSWIKIDRKRTCFLVWITFIQAGYFIQKLDILKRVLYNGLSKLTKLSAGYPYPLDKITNVNTNGVYLRFLRCNRKNNKATFFWCTKASLFNMIVTLTIGRGWNSYNWFVVWGNET